MCDVENKTALYYASETNNHNAILCLLEFGASPYIKDNINNKNCIEVAKSVKTKDLIINN